MLEDRRRYRKAYLRLWKNRAFRLLPDAEKVMTCYLLFGPQSNRLGLFHVSAGLGVEDLNWSLPLFRKRAEKVCQTFGWHFDRAVNVVWMPSWWDFNDVRENFKVMQGALSDLDEVPETPLKDKFLAHLDFVPNGLRYLFENLSARRAIPGKVWTSGIQDQEQEQKQEQEQEQEQEQDSALAPRVTVGPPMDELFEQFRDAYPASRRVGGDLARRGFYSALKDRDIPAHFALMLAALEQHKRSEQWHTPKLIPLMTTWLNQERWTQVLPESSPMAQSGKTAGNQAALERFVARRQGGL